MSLTSVGGVLNWCSGGERIFRLVETPLMKLIFSTNEKINFELDYSDLFYKKNDTYFLLLKLHNGDLRYGEIS